MKATIYTNTNNPNEEFFTEEYIYSNFDDFEEMPFSTNKKTGVIFSTIMIALGIMAIFFALPFGIGLGYIATAGLGIYGIAQIINYVQAKSERRNGWTLANGILSTLFSLFLLWSSLGNAYGSLQLISVITFSIGFFTLSNGIDQVHSFSILRKRNTSGAGWILASGIINLILSVFMIINPVLSWFSLSLIWGMYLIVTGIAFFIETLSNKKTVYIQMY